MIYQVDGLPGAGKTFFIVRWITDRYYDWDKDYQEFKPKTSIPPDIYTNVEGLNLPHVHSLKEAIENSPERVYEIDGVVMKCRAGTKESFFSRLNTEISNSIIVVDEAQSEKFFPLKYKEASTIDFFSWHRHLGLEIFLLVQDAALLSVPIRKLCQSCWCACNPELRLGGFRYNKVVDDVTVSRSLMRYDKRIFGIYHSVEAGAEHKKVKSVLGKFVILGLIGIIVFGFGFHMFLGMFRNRVVEHKGVGARTAVAATVPPSGVVLQGGVWVSTRDAQSQKVDDKSAGIDKTGTVGPVAGVHDVVIGSDIGSNSHKFDEKDEVKVSGICRLSVSLESSEGFFRTYDCDGFSLRFHDGVLIYKHHIRLPVIAQSPFQRSSVSSPASVASVVVPVDEKTSLVQK